MTIGIAIPTYWEHVEFLDRLLDSIARSTVQPSQVCVSMSEYGREINKDYPFDLIVLCTPLKRNVAQNTNRALSMLTTDIVSVIGGDDMVHPQRNEFLLRAFAHPKITAVVHNFHQDTVVNEAFLSSRYDLMELYVNYIDTLYPNIPYPTSAIEHLDFANGFISFRRELLSKYSYDESPEAEYIEDSLFNRKLVEDGYKISYIPQKLALYLKNPHRKP